MYLQYFGLSEAPFSITPDPRFVFMGARHEDAMAHLMYGITEGGGGGFVQLTGEVGTGKTTLCRCLIEQLPDNVQVALVLNPKLDPLELLETVCEELKVSTRAARGSQKKLTDRLNRHLLKAHGEGRHVVLILDEAQNLSPEALEQVRLLTNLETASKKLLQIVLLGQPELRQLLARPDLRQLAQRITARYHLEALDPTETADYLAHRLKVAGAAERLFTASGARAVHRRSGGVPRLINIIAERSLVAAYARGVRRIDRALVGLAADEVLARDGDAIRPRPQWLIPASVAATLALMTAIWFWPRQPAPVAMRGANSLPTAFSRADGSPSLLPAQAAEQAPGSTAPPLPGEPFASAWQRLLDERGIPAIQAADGRCPTQATPGVECLQGRADLARLEALGRPVLARFSANDDRYGVVEFRDGAVALRVGDEHQWLAVEEMLGLWSGAYLDVFAMPGYMPEVLREGDRGPAVLWLKSLAARATPVYPADASDPYFGPALRLWIENFQRRSGLRDDGLVGRETLQLLSRYAPNDHAGAP